MPKNTDLTIEEDEIVEVDNDESDTEDTDDGGAMVKLKNEDDQRQKQAHFANIVDEVDQGDLQDAVTDLLDKVAKDKDARQKRDKLYEEGLRRTGLGDDAPGGAQFTGSTKVVHPMLVEACVDFSSRVMKEIFPPRWPSQEQDPRREREGQGRQSRAQDRLYELADYRADARVSRRVRATQHATAIGRRSVPQADVECPIPAPMR